MDTRDSDGSENNLSSRTTKTSVFALAILSMMASFPLFTAGGGINTSTLPLSFTFIIKIGGPNIYQGFVTGGNALTPQYSESNVTKLIHDDIEQGGFCVNGCSATVNPGSYNVTQTIPVDRDKFGIFGSLATIFKSQTTFNSMIFNVTANSFTLQGLRIDDVARIAQTTPAHDGIDVWGNNCIITQAQIFNITFQYGINLRKTSNNCILTYNTIIGSLGFPAPGNNAGIVMAGSGHAAEFNTISLFAGQGGISMGNGIINNAKHISAIGNTLFRNEYGIRVLSGLWVTITGNQIFNSSSMGIIVTTSIIVSKYGPLTIAGNQISESNQNFCCSSGTNSSAHLLLQASRCCYNSIAITGNTFIDRQTPPTTRTDIEVSSANFNNLTITGNALGSGILTQSPIVLNGFAVKTWIISANPGFNPQPKRTITITTNPFTYTNNDVYPEQLQIDTIAGGLATVTCRGNVLPTPVIGELSPILNTLDTCVFTGTTTDTFDVLPT